jgi:hypothetical protein
MEQSVRVPGDPGKVLLAVVHAVVGSRDNVRAITLTIGFEDIFLAGSGSRLSRDGGPGVGRCGFIFNWSRPVISYNLFHTLHFSCNSVSIMNILFVPPQYHRSLLNAGITFHHEDPHH